MRAFDGSRRLLWQLRWTRSSPAAVRTARIVRTAKSRASGSWPSRIWMHSDIKLAANGLVPPESHTGLEVAVTPVGLRRPNAWGLHEHGRLSLSVVVSSYEHRDLATSRFGLRVFVSI